MARHETFTLDSETATHAAAMRHTLTHAHSDGYRVRMTGTKRDGTPFDRTGDIVGFVGSIGMSSEAVLVETDKGPRTFNVWCIRSVQIVG